MRILVIEIPDVALVADPKDVVAIKVQVQRHSEKYEFALYRGVGFTVSAFSTSVEIVGRTP